MSFPTARTLRVFLALAIAQLAFAGTASARGLEIKEPSDESAVSGTIRFSATAAGHPRSVSFFVDGERRWTDHSRPYRGTVDASSLEAGSHRFSIKASYRKGKRRRDSVVVSVGQGVADGDSDAAPAPRTGAGSPAGGSAPPPSADPAVADPPGGSLLWNSDFESGSFSQWEGVQAFNAGRASVVSSPSTQGSHAGRFEVREGEFTLNADAPTRNRSEAVLSVKKNRHNPKEGDDWWYSWSFYLPSSTPLPQAGGTNYMIITQWPSLAPTTSSDFELNGVLEFRDTKASGDPGPGYVEFLYADGSSRPDGNDYMWRKNPADIQRDAWHKIMIHKKWSSDPSKGFIEIWFDDVEQTLTDGSTRMNLRTKHANYGAYMKQGIYRSNAIGGTGVVYHDGLRIGTTRAAVD